jgi:hypothetical protein
MAMRVDAQALPVVMPVPPATTVSIVLKTGAPAVCAEEEYNQSELQTAGLPRMRRKVRFYCGW